MLVSILGICFRASERVGQAVERATYYLALTNVPNLLE